MFGSSSRHRKTVPVHAILGTVTALVFSLVFAAAGTDSTRSPAEAAQAAGPRLVSMEPLPEDPSCAWVPTTAAVSRAAQFFFPHVFSATPAALAALQPGQEPAAPVAPGRTMAHAWRLLSGSPYESSRIGIPHSAPWLSITFAMKWS